MISTRSVGLVIDTVVCLTLDKWETVSGQFGGYLMTIGARAAVTARQIVSVARIHKWLQAIYLCGWQDIRPSCLSRVLGVTFKTAAFIIDRIHYVASNTTLNERGRASLLPEQLPERLIEQTTLDGDDGLRCEALD
jgi:hypothetical protein